MAALPPSTIQCALGKSSTSRRCQIQVAWVIAMVLSSTFLVLCDVFHPYAPKLFPLQPTLILSAALHCAGPVLVTMLGRAVHGSEVYFVFQPFAGGAVFVILQCIGSILWIASGALILLFSALHHKAIVRQRLEYGAAESAPASPLLLGGGVQVLHGPLVLAGILSFASSGFLHRSISVFVKGGSWQEEEEKKKKTSTTKKKTGSSPTSPTKTQQSDNIWAALSKSPNAESILVLVLSIATLVTSLFARCILYSTTSPSSSSSSLPDGMQDVLPAIIESWVFIALAGFHLVAACISHFSVGWMHTPNYRLFNPFGNVPWKTIVAQGAAWSGIILGLVMLIVLGESNEKTTREHHMMYPLFGLISCGSNLGLLLNIRLTRHSAESSGSRANLASQGPFIATSAALIQAMLVLALHSDQVFPIWVTGGEELSTPGFLGVKKVVPPWEGLRASLFLTQAVLLWWPLVTHVLGTFVHGKSYSIWAPFNGKADFILAQSIGWTSYVVSMTCTLLFLAGGEMSELWSLSAVASAVISQVLIHTSVRVFKPFTGKSSVVPRKQQRQEDVQKKKKVQKQQQPRPPPLDEPISPGGKQRRQSGKPDGGVPPGLSPAVKGASNHSSSSIKKILLLSPAVSVAADRRRSSAFATADPITPTLTTKTASPTTTTTTLHPPASTTSPTTKNTKTTPTTPGGSFTTTNNTEDNHDDDDVRFVNGEWLVGVSCSLAAFVVFTACDRVGPGGLYSADFPDFPIKTMVLVGTLLYLVSCPFVQVSGWDKFGLRTMFTPFQGSAEYVSLQAVGWTVYAILMVFFASHGLTLMWVGDDGERGGSGVPVSFYAAVAWLCQLPCLLVSASLFLESRNLRLDHENEAAQRLTVTCSSSSSNGGVYGSPACRRGWPAVSPVSLRRTLSPSPGRGGFPRGTGGGTMGTMLLNSPAGGSSCGWGSPAALTTTATTTGSLDKLLARFTVDDTAMLAQIADFSADDNINVKQFLQEAISVAQRQKQLLSGQVPIHNNNNGSSSPSSGQGSPHDWSRNSSMSLGPCDDAFEEEDPSYAHSVAAVGTFLACMASSVLFGVAAWMRSTNQIPQSIVLTVCGMLISSGTAFGLHAIYGPAVYPNKSYKFWQPFAGGPPFIALQAFGYGCIATCTVLGITTVLAPQGGGVTSLICASLLSTVAIIAVYASVRKFDVRAKSKPAGLLENNAEAVVSVLLLAVSGTLGKLHEMMDPFGDLTVAAAAGAADSGTLNYTHGDTRTIRGSNGNSLNSHAAVLSVAPLFLSFSALSLAVPLAAVAVRRAAKQNLDLLDPEEEISTPVRLASPVIPTPTPTTRKKKTLQGGAILSSSEEGKKSDAKSGGFLVSAFSVGVRFIAPLSFVVVPLFIIYGFYYALQSSGAIALAILRSGGLVLSLGLGAIAVLAVLKVREDFLTWFWATVDYGIAAGFIVGIAVWCIILRPATMNQVSFFNSVMFCLAPEAIRPVVVFGNVVLCAHLFHGHVTSVLTTCGWWSSSSSGLASDEYYYCVSRDAFGEIFLALEFLGVVWLNFAYYRTYLGEPDVTGRRFTESFHQWFKDTMVSAKVKWFQLSVVSEAGRLPDDQQYMYGYHPHGIIPATAGWVVNSELWAEAVGPRFVTTHGAGVIFKCPLLRDIPLKCGCRVVSKKGLNTSISQGNSVQLVPGGQAELIKSRVSTTELYLITRHVGFIRLALERNIPVVPVLCFGEQDLLDNIHHEKMQKWCLRMTGVAFPVLPMGAMYSPMPSKKRLSIVVGNPIPVPAWYLASTLGAVEDSQTSGSSLTPAGREAKAVDEMADAYWLEVKRIFEKHKVAAGYPAMKLSLEERPRQFQLNAKMVVGYTGNTPTTPEKAVATTKSGGGGSPGGQSAKKLSNKDLKKVTSILRQPGPPTTPLQKQKEGVERDSSGTWDSTPSPLLLPRQQSSPKTTFNSSWTHSVSSDRNEEEEDSTAAATGPGVPLSRKGTGVFPRERSGSIKSGSGGKNIGGKKK